MISFKVTSEELRDILPLFKASLKLPSNLQRDFKENCLKLTVLQDVGTIEVPILQSNIALPHLLKFNCQVLKNDEDSSSFTIPLPVHLLNALSTLPSPFTAFFEIITSDEAIFVNVENHTFSYPFIKDLNTVIKGIETPYFATDEILPITAKDLIKHLENALSVVEKPKQSSISPPIFQISYQPFEGRLTTIAKDGRMTYVWYEDTIPIDFEKDFERFTIMTYQQVEKFIKVLKNVDDVLISWFDTDKTCITVFTINQGFTILSETTKGMSIIDADYLQQFFVDENDSQFYYKGNVKTLQNSEVLLPNGKTIGEVIKKLFVTKFFKDLHGIVTLKGFYKNEHNYCLGASSNGKMLVNASKMTKEGLKYV